MTHPRLLRMLAALTAVLCLAPVVPAAAQDYPRLGLYWSIHRDGRPLLDAGGNMDPAVAGAITRYHEVVVDVDPLSPYRPDVLLALRQQRPDIRLLAYVTGHYIWYSADPDSLNHYPTRYWRTVRDLDGFLYNKAGQQFGLTNSAFANVNLAKRDAQGHYAVAESLASLFNDVIVKSGNWDGVFLDTYCEGILWAQAPAESIDYVRAGYASLAAFGTAWKAGGDTLASRLRALAGSTPILVGNCAQGTKYAWFNGWMRENFPYQNGGSWYTNMFGDPGGYFVDEARFRAPRNNFIFTAASPPGAPYWPDNLRRVRFGLASAALGDGYGVFGYGGRVTDAYPFYDWWYDEYAVDLATGRSSALARDTGWLGQPLAPYYQMIWAGTNPDAVSNPDVEADLGGWTYYAHPSVSATLTRDTTTAGKGKASLKVHVGTASAVDWYANVGTVNTIPVISGTTYSATFWARASSARTIALSVNAPGVGEIGRASAAITTSWKQYQVALVAYGSASAKLQFFLAVNAGDVWLDDVHFQQGATTIYRRDFQHGAVLVNPSDVDLTVPVGGNYRRILGNVDPVVNDGAAATSLVVPASDARFVIGIQDLIPPAPVIDLHIGP